MPAKKTTPKKTVAAAARKLATRVVKAVKAAPAKIKTAARAAKAAVRRKPAPAKKPSAIPSSRPAAPRIKSTVRKLPESYGTKKLFLVARDPRWLYAYWDFTLAEQRALNKLATGGHLTLRIFKENFDGRLIAEVGVEAEARHWFVPVARGDTNYVAELGYTAKRGGWVSIARSNSVLTPSETIATDAPVVMVTLPPDVPFEQIFQSLGESLAENLPLTEIIRQSRAAGQTKLPEVLVFPAMQRWTPAQIRELDKLAGAKSVRRRIITELASLSAAHILPEQTEAAGEAENAADTEAVSASSPSGAWSGDLT